MTVKSAGKTIGYIRVSTVEQNTSQQLEGIALDKEFTDKCSGKDTKRPSLQLMLDYVSAILFMFTQWIDWLGT
jgi:DNA invertase Pin-like site-specific DNA recombinase